MTEITPESTKIIITCDQSTFACPSIF